MRRLQFRLSTLLWLTLAVACWFGGAEWGWRREEPRIYRKTTMGAPPDYLAVDILEQPDGTKWYRPIGEGDPGRTAISFLDEQGTSLSVQRRSSSSARARSARPVDPTPTDDESASADQTESERESPTYIYEESIIRGATDAQEDDGNDTTHSTEPPHEGQNP